MALLRAGDDSRETKQPIFNVHQDFCLQVNIDGRKQLSIW
jgi:hypothetical protein